MSMYDLTLRRLLLGSVTEKGDPEEADEAQEEQEALESSEALGVRADPFPFEVMCEAEKKVMVGEEDRSAKTRCLYGFCGSDAT